MVDVAISAIGMATSLGSTATASCAAARAGIVRAQALDEIAFQSDADWAGEAIYGHRVRDRGRGCVGLAKVLALAKVAFEDLVDRLMLRKQDWDKTTLHVALSDRFVEDACERDRNVAQNADPAESGPLPSEAWRMVADQVLGRLVDELEVPIPPDRRSVHLRGSSGIEVAIREAEELLVSGRASRCIVGGVDSLVEPRVLAAFRAKGMLRSAEQPHGFIPGEAAAFLCLERTSDLRSRHSRPMAHMERATLSPAQGGRFDGPPTRGGALFDVLASHGALSDERAEDTFLVGDLNGDPFRSLRWGHALARSAQAGRLGRRPMWLPALSFGETGAASGALGLCLAARAFARGYAPHPRALIWNVSDAGEAGCVTIVDAEVA